MSIGDGIVMIDQGEIIGIRKKMAEIGSTSHTSIKFQDDLLRWIAEAAPHGESIIEVGCYKGGLTSQIAYAAKQLGLVFDVIDIDHHYLNVAAAAVAAVGLQDYARFHAMDLASFVEKTGGQGKVALVFVDGEHRYHGVVADCRAIKTFSAIPHAAVFHDYSLRYADGELSDVRVDLGIKDEFGDSVRLVPIGELAGAPGSSLRTQPGEDRHYHQIDTSEGVVVLLA